MRRVGVITAITCLWCLILIAVAGTFILGPSHLKNTEVGEWPNYIVAAGLIIVAILAFLHKLPAMILSGLLAAFCLLVEIAGFQKLGSGQISKAWPGLVVAAFGIIYVFNWFWKRSVLKEMDKGQ